MIRRQRPQAAIALQIVLAMLAQDVLWAFPGAFRSSGPTAAARLDSLAPSREFPWINLRLYRTPDPALRPSVRIAQGPVVSMLAGDYDEDGIQDLVSVSRLPGGSRVRLHKGNVDALYPNSPEARRRKALGTFTDRPFFDPVETGRLAFEPGLTVAADFNGDGHLDLAAAVVGESDVHFFPGDGSGNLGPPQAVDQGMPISHLIAADINRRDGIRDLVVGLRGEPSQVRIYEGPHGAMGASPEVHQIAGELSALTVGQLDADPAIDIAAAAGNELTLIRGRDRRISVSRPAEPVTVDDFRLGFEIRQLVTGDFSGDHRYELAALGDDGAVRLITLSRTAQSPAIQLWRSPPAPELGAATISSSTRKALVAARVSTFSKHDLVLFEQGSGTMAVLVEATPTDPVGSLRHQAGGAALEVRYSTPAGLKAIVPMRLGPDALDDLVMAAGGTDEVAIAQTTPNNTYTVNTNETGNDLNTADGVCDFDPGTAGNQCNWHSALRSANGTPGLDKIDFSIDDVQPIAGVPPITDSILVDGTSRGRVAFDGSILLRNIGNNVVRGLALHGAGHRLDMQTFGDNIVESNYFGTLDGVTAAPNGWLSVRDSPRNQIGGTAAEARNVFGDTSSTGILISGEGSTDNVVEGNYVGTDTAGLSLIDNRTAGVSMSAGASNNTMGGLSPGGRNVVAGALRGVDFTTGATANLVQGNYIGPGADGMTALGNNIGVSLADAHDNLIGGTIPAARNVISGNTGHGISLPASASGSSSSNLIQGNFLGLDATGAAPLSNAGDGVDARQSTLPNTIGGEGQGAGNVIAHNGGDGVHSSQGSTSILGNSIFSNDQLGIRVDLADAPVAPVVTAAGAGSIEGTLTTTPDTEFRIEIFSSEECDPSGFGEGQTFLGAVSATTDGTGNASFSAPFALQGPTVTATSTGPDGSTSAFSNCLEVPQDNATITSITPDPNLGFPNVNPDLTVPFSQIGIDFTLVSDTSGTIVVQALADGDAGRVLGEAQEPIAATEQQPDGSIVVGQLIATNVTPDLNSIWVQAFVKPDNSNSFTTASTPVVYEHTEGVGFVSLSPDPVTPLTGGDTVTFVTTIQARLVSAQAGFVELQIRDSNGDLLVEAPFLPVEFGLNTVELEATIEIPDDSNTITLDALLRSGAGFETITDPSVVYHANRIRMTNLNPLPTMLLQGGKEQTFETTADFNVATQTNQASILLAVLDSDGTVLDPVSGNDLVENLSSGAGSRELSVTVAIPEDATTLTLAAILVDLAGSGVELARDEKTYQFTLAGRVIILSSGPDIPLVRARVTAEPLVGDIVEDFTDADGIYRLALPVGTYKLTAEPPEEDRGFRLSEEIIIEVDEQRNSLPDFELGTANRKDLLINLALSLGTLGGTTFAVDVINQLGLFPPLPYLEEIDQLNGFANSQPAPPDKTEEGLYRLFLATRAVKSMADDANTLLDDIASPIAGLIPGLGLLGDLDEKLKDAFEKFVPTQTTRIVEKVIESSSMQTMFEGVLNRSSSLVDSVRSHLLNFLVNSIAGGQDSWAPRFKKAFDALMTKLLLDEDTLGGELDEQLPGGALDKAVSDQFTSIVKEILLAFYLFLTDDSIERSVTSAAIFQPDDDALRFDQTAVNNAISASAARSASVQSDTIGLVNDLFSSLKKGFDVISVGLVPFLAFPPTTAVVVPIHATFRRLSELFDYFTKFFDAKKLLDTGLRVYTRIPQELDLAVGKAFGQDSFDFLEREQQATTRPAAIAPASRIGFLNAGSDFQASLERMIMLVQADEFQELVDHMPVVLEADAAFEAELRGRLGPLLGEMIPTIASVPSSRPAFESILEDTIASVLGRILLYFNLLSYVSEATEIDSFEDPAYLARKSELVAALEEERARIDRVHSAAEAATEAAATAGTSTATAVITQVRAVSAGSEIHSLSVTPQSFSIFADISNHSNQTLAGLEVEIPTPLEILGVSLESEQRISLGTLDPGESVQVNWQLTFDPDTPPAAVPLQVVLEAIPEGSVFIPGSFYLLLPFVEAADADEDGLPDGYETAFSLGVNQISSHLDKDGDGLINYSEYLIGTLPDKADTDDDGVSDGAEVEAGSDPLAADSTPASVARETGDVNKDGIVNIQDVAYLLRHLSGQGPPPFPLSLGDVNGDDLVDVNDVTVLLSQLGSQ